MAKDQLVTLDNLLVAVETEKAWGIIPFATIRKSINVESVTKFNEIKDQLKLMLVWVPKSKLTEVSTEPYTFFTNLKMQYGSKINPELILYQTKLKCNIPQWIAEENNLIDKEGDDETVEDSSNSDW